MKVNHYGGFMEKGIEDILSHADLKQSLVALKEFKTTLIEAKFSKSETEDITKFIAIYVYLLHFNIQLANAKIEPSSDNAKL